jgi:hypothetical protein
VQRIEDLGLVEGIRRDVALAQRRHPKVDESLSERSAAKATNTLGHNTSI